MWRDKPERHGDGSRTAILPPGLTDLTTPAAVPDPALPLSSQPPAVLLAMCLFGEARGEADSALRAVAQVVLNRAQHPHPVFGSRPGLAFEENLRRVILRPGQFSCFHPADVNYAKLIRPLEAEDAPVWERCLHCAEQALSMWNQQDTIAENSDHYFDDSIQPPSWADPAKRTVKLGRLNFYRLYLPAPEGNLSGTPIVEFPPSSDGPSGAAASNSRSSLTPAASGALSASSIPSQEPPKQEPAAGRPSPATGLVSGSAASQPPAARRGITEAEVPHTHEPPSPGPALCLEFQAANAQRRPRTGRLSSLKTVASNEWRVTRRAAVHFHLFRKGFMKRFLLRSSLITRNDAGVSFRLSLLFFCLLLTGCSDFERAAYRTLAVTQAEYETVQRHMAEAAAHGLITEQQWNRFAAEGHRFIDAHNAAVDAFELWSRAKNQGNEARVQALLEILPRLVRELNSLVESFESEPRPEESGDFSPNARTNLSDFDPKELQWL